MTKRDHQAFEYAVERGDRDTNCGNCRWFSVFDDSSSGECRRYPPSPAKMAGDAGEHVVTSKDNYCGEFATAGLERRDG